MDKHKYLNEVSDLEAIVVSRSQSVQIRAEPSTLVGQIVERNFDFLEQSGVDAYEIVRAIIAILDLLNLKGWFGTFFKIGKIIFKAIGSSRKKRASDWADRINRYFVVQEFVDRRYYDFYGSKSKQIINPAIIRIATFIRETTGRAVIGNTWKWGGRFSQRGFRASWSRTGGKKSAHRKGDGFDFNVSGWSTEQVHAFLKKHEKELFVLGLRRVERSDYTKGWTHIDTKPTGKDHVHYFIPY